MSLSAKNSETGQTIFADDFRDIRAEYPDWRKLVSPFTGAPLQPVRSYSRSDGTDVRAHFRELASITHVWADDLILDPEYCRVSYGDRGRIVSAGERDEHILGKRFVAMSAPAELDRHLSTARATYEHIIRLPTGKRRIIDVAFLFPCGAIEAHEVQLASITPQELEERTFDYHSLGIPVTWWFGLEAFTKSNVQWCKDLSVRFLVLEFKKDEIAKNFGGTSA